LALIEWKCARLPAVLQLRAGFANGGGLPAALLHTGSSLLVTGAVAPEETDVPPPAYLQSSPVWVPSLSVSLL